MKSQEDPPRLKDMTEDVPAWLAASLGDVRGAAPEPGDLDAVKRGVWGTLGLGPGSSPPVQGPQGHGPAATGVVGGAAGAKSVLAVALPWFAAPVGIAVVSGAVMLGLAGGGKTPDVPGSLASAAGAVVPPTSKVAPALAPRPADPSADSLVTDPPPPREEVGPGGRARPDATTTAPRSKEAPSTVARAIDAPRVPPPSAPESELSLLAGAQASLAADPARALSITDDHIRRFGSGTLSQEREVIAIGALVRLGRMAEARARAERFHALYPTSAHGRRIDVLLGSP
jgi:hypothetical protein